MSNVSLWDSNTHNREEDGKIGTHVPPYKVSPSSSCLIKTCVMQSVGSIPEPSELLTPNYLNTGPAFPCK